MVSSVSSSSLVVLCFAAKMLYSISLCCFVVVFRGAKIVKILQCRGVFSGEKKFVFFCCFLLAVSKKSVFLRCSLVGTVFKGL